MKVIYPKTLLSILLLGSLTACSSGLSGNQPKYKISDQDTQKWIERGNQVEQCVFQKEYKNKTFNQLSVEERMLHNNGVFQSTLAEVIGLDNAQIVLNDPASTQYLKQQYDKFNHSNPTDFDKSWCDEMRASYQQALKKMHVEKKKQEKEQLARQQQEEKERRAQDEFYASREGQAHLAQQRILAEQQRMQQQALLQQQAYQQQMLAQQRAYQQQLAAQQAAQSTTAFDVFNQAVHTMNSITQSMQQTANAYNQAAESMARVNAGYNNSWNQSQNSSTTCYRLANGIVRCNHH